MRSLFLFDIRFPLMDGKYFTENISHLKLLTKDETMQIIFQMVNKDYFACTNGDWIHGQSKFNNTKRYEAICCYQPYTLIMSSFYIGPKNTYSALVSDDTTKGAETKCGQNEFIQAKFSQTITIRQIQVAAATGMAGTWDPKYINGRYLQYLDDSTQNWINVTKISNVSDTGIKTIVVDDIETTSIRVICSDCCDYVGLGYLRIKGLSV